MRQPRFTEHLDISMDEETYARLTGTSSNMDSSSPTFLGLQAVPREMFHEASWRPMHDQRAQHENEMAGYGADQQSQVQKDEQFPPPTDPEDEDDDLDVTADLVRCNSFDYVLQRSNELAADGTSNPPPTQLTPPPRQPTRAHTSSTSNIISFPYEEIELRDMSAPAAPPPQTRPPEALSLRKKICRWWLSVCDAYSEDVMKEKIVEEEGASTSTWKMQTGPSMPGRAR